MCGICGIYNYKYDHPVKKDLIEKMSDSMAHRGPDDRGTYLNNSIGFGFRRLSIIDIKSGHQPMTDINKQIWIVFNGEIYNFKELKEELKSIGYIFRTESDTEVIINGYKEWGENVLNHLNGMFGLALWDELKKKLLIARDPMGIKLIYYKIVDDQIVFGSEIKPVLVSEKIIVRLI